MTEGADGSIILGVEKSVSGRRWVSRAYDESYVLAASQRYGLPDLVGRLLSARGVPLEAIDTYLDPRLKTSLPDPSSLRDMGRAVERLVKALEEKQKIAIFGDYDVDGATSTALMVSYLSSLGADVTYYIPDRIKEGYGPNVGAITHLHEQGVRLIVTVDCGTMAHDPLQHARKLGLDVIVVDHHQSADVPPPAYALVNPRRADDTSRLGHLAAVGVSFLVIVGLNRALRELGWFEALDEPNLLNYLDLVALGTVCDVVPLQDVNRAFVSQGLKILQSGNNVGLAALARVARAQPPYGTYELGFMLGPRVNAGGRVGESSLGARLLLSSSHDEVSALAMRLDDYNTERRAIESKVLNEAIERAEHEIAGQNMVPSALILGDKAWHAGVIGIVAGRIKDRFQRPVFIVSFDEDGNGKGSGRSVPGFDLGRLVTKAVDRGLILGGGGHAMAAGISLKADQLEEFSGFIREECQDAAVFRHETLKCDGAISPSGASRALYEQIQHVGPYGAGNPEPRLVLPSVHIAFSDTVGDGHVRCQLKDQNGGRIKAIAFSSVEEAVRRHLLSHKGPLHVVGYLRADDWQGRNDVQFNIQDIAIP